VSRGKVPQETDVRSGDFLKALKGVLIPDRERREREGEKRMSEIFAFLFLLLRA